MQQIKNQTISFSLVQNALFHHSAQGFCHGFCNCPHWTWWYMSLQPRGLSIVTKVYGNKVFQGLLKDNNHWNKLNFVWCLFVSEVWSQSPYKPIPIPIRTYLPLISSFQAMVFHKIFWTSTTFTSFIPTLSILTCLWFLSSYQNW